MKTPDIIKIAAQNLRNNSTPSEVLVWNEIKNEKLWAKFLRQKPVYVYTEDNWLDRFIIADFYCFEKKLIIEIDGNIHDFEEVYELDRVKEELLKNLWYRVIRVKNEEVLSDMDGVLEMIRECLIN